MPTGHLQLLLSAAMVPSLLLKLRQPLHRLLHQHQLQLQLQLQLPLLHLLQDQLQHPLLRLLLPLK